MSRRRSALSRRSGSAGSALAAPVPGHPERLIPDVPPNAREATLWRQLLAADRPPWWLRMLAELRWIAGMGAIVCIPEPPPDFNGEVGHDV